jgi:hypothetical protein
MKKTKFDYLLEMLKEILDYLDNHKIQGRILFTGVSASIILLSLKFITDDLIKIIEVLK